MGSHDLRPWVENARKLREGKPRQRTEQREARLEVQEGANEHLLVCVNARNNGGEAAPLLLMKPGEYTHDNPGPDLERRRQEIDNYLTVTRGT